MIELRTYAGNVMCQVCKKKLILSHETNYTKCVNCGATYNEQGLTEREYQIKHCLNLTVELWNTFLKIEEKHQSDSPETAHDIHNIQNRLLALTADKDKFLTL